MSSNKPEPHDTGETAPRTCFSISVPSYQKINGNMQETTAVREQEGLFVKKNEKKNETGASLAPLYSWRDVVTWSEIKGMTCSISKAFSQ